MRVRCRRHERWKRLRLRLRYSAPAPWLRATTSTQSGLTGCHSSSVEIALGSSLFRTSQLTSTALSMSLVQQGKALVTTLVVRTNQRPTNLSSSVPSSLQPDILMEENKEWDGRGDLALAIGNMGPKVG